MEVTAQVLAAAVGARGVAAAVTRSRAEVEANSHFAGDR